MNDLRYALRQLLKNPGFTAVAVLTLALGIGANTAIFSFINAILLRPLPYPAADRLVMVFENHAENGMFQIGVGAPMLAEWRRQSASFVGLGAQTYVGPVILTGPETPETLKGVRLSANVFDLLGVQPLLGRSFRTEEETFGNHQVVLLSHELWQRRFGGDPNIVGRTITLDSEPKTVVGVMPPGIHHPQRGVEVWQPLAFSWELQARHAHNFLVVGRLRPDVSLAQADAEMKLVAARLAAADETNKGWGAEVHALADILVGDVRRPLLVLLAAVGFVLLIACANIANLLLTRSAARCGEFAIRAALGAGRRQLVRQLLAESLLLFLLGGLAGVLLAAAGLEILIRLSPPDLPRIWEGIRLDGMTLSFTAFVTLATGLLCGLVPAWQATNPALALTLSESARGGAAARRTRLRNTLIVGEVALSVMLLIGAGLLIRSFDRLLTQEKGYQPEHLITLTLNLPGRQYPGQGERERLFDQLLESLRSLPGVQAAGGLLGLPLGNWRSSLHVEILGETDRTPGLVPAAGYAQVSPGYFAAMRVPFVAGRDFTPDDRTNTTPVLIVDEAFVRNFHLGTNVIGRRIQVGDNTGKAEIIGVVRTIKNENLATPPRGEMYRSYKQESWGQMTVVVRTQRSPAELTRAIRDALDQLDKNLPFDDVRTMTQLVAASVAPQRLSLRLLTAFAGAALGLAAIGLYGVLAHTVTQRRREIGVRLALGAQRRAVLGLVIGQGMRLALVGTVLGLAGAFALARVLRSQLFEVHPADPLTFTAVPLMLAVVALLACWLPARRAARVDPMIALRSE
jgi:putative ABC transport system permease protein